MKTDFPLWELLALALIGARLFVDSRTGTVMPLAWVFWAVTVVNICTDSAGEEKLAMLLSFVLISGFGPHFLLRPSLLNFAQFFIFGFTVAAISLAGCLAAVLIYAIRHRSIKPSVQWLKRAVCEILVEPAVLVAISPLIMLRKKILIADTAVGWVSTKMKFVYRL